MLLQIQAVCKITLQKQPGQRNDKSPFAGFLGNTDAVYGNQRAEQNKNGRKKKAVSGIASKAEYTVIKRRKQGRSFYKPVVAVPEQSGGIGKDRVNCRGRKGDMPQKHQQKAAGQRCRKIPQMVKSSVKKQVF